jgi:hypothetical protein
MLSTFTQWLGYCSADVISEMTFSERTDFMEAREDENIMESSECLRLGYMQYLFAHFDSTLLTSSSLNADLIRDDIQRSAFDVVQPTWLVQHSKSLVPHCHSTIHREETALGGYQGLSV